MKISPLTLLKVYLPALCFIVLATLLAQAIGISEYELVADPSEVSQQSAFVGFLSQVGNLFWCATAAICSLAAFVLYKNGARVNHPLLFIVFSGLLSAQFLFDDQFRIHEKFGKVLYGADAVISRTAQDLAELAVFAVYGLVLVAFVVAFRKLILDSNPVFLVLTIVFFVLSTIIDMTPETMPKHHILEEGCKLLGIISWFTYFFNFCAEKIQQQFTLGTTLGHPGQNV